MADELAVLGRVFSLTLNLGRPGTILTNRRPWKGMLGNLGSTLLGAPAVLSGL